VKRDRKDSAWYQHRLEEAKKPRPMTQNEKDSLHMSNNDLLAEAKSLVQRAIDRGWMSYPKRLTVADLKKHYDQEIQKRLHRDIEDR
jgi:hypothetical protein